MPKRRNQHSKLSDFTTNLTLKKHKNKLGQILKPEPKIHETSVLHPEFPIKNPKILRPNHFASEPSEADII